MNIVKIGDFKDDTSLIKIRVLNVHHRPPYVMFDDHP
jgi:hypothetical protein